MSRLTAFLVGCFTVLVLALGIRQTAAQVAFTPDGKTQTFLRVPEGSVSVPAGGMGVMSDAHYLYIFRANSNKVTCVSKTSAKDGKPEIYEISLTR